MAKFTPCPVDDCGKRVFSAGMCWGHLKEVRLRVGDLCSLDRCGRPRFGRELCARHHKARYLRSRPKSHLRCGWCHQVFGSADSAQRFCSAACGSRGTAHLRRKSREVEVHPNPSPLVWLPKAHPVIRPPRHPSLPGTLFVEGACDWCGKRFMQCASTYETRSLTCSKQCLRARAKHRRRERRGRFTVSPARRRRIYERDGWTCQLCDEPVDRDAHYLDDWAPTLDHIVPQSHVLVPDHSDRNLRTAHRWCNSIRGDDRYYTAADLTAV